jgi:uncharacterized protein
MLWLRLGVGLALAYLVLLVVVWLFQERIAFPAPRAPVPDPKRVGIADGERMELVTRSGTKIVGWFLGPRETGRDGEGRGGRERAPLPVSPRPSPSFPALLWFYGNGENIASIWPILRDFQPPGAALLVVDYPGYGASGGRATEAALYEAADSAYAALTSRLGVDSKRLYVYGRSLGTAVASYTAANHPVAGLILESPFTNAREMSGQHYKLFPEFVLRLGLDNLAHVPRIHCPLLVFHGTADLLVPTAMGRRVAQVAPGPVELVLIDGAGHNDTYELGGKAYRDKLWSFVSGES